MSLSIKGSAQVWRQEFYQAFVLLAVTSNHGSEAELLQDLLLDKDRLDQLVDEALVSHLEPSAAASEFVAYLFLPRGDER